MMNKMAMIILNEKKFGSKVNGRRNYVIKTYDNKVFAGNQGHFPNCFYSETIGNMAEHGILWMWFTYKKDMMETLKYLEEEGCKVVMR